MKIMLSLILLLISYTQLNATELYFGGDIMLSRTVGAISKVKGTDYFLSDYNPTKDLSQDTTLLFNLESPFSNPDKDTNARTFSFGANKKNVEILDELRGNRRMILSLANNHIMNSGFKGLQLTIDTLTENGIFYVGVSKNKRQAFRSFKKGNSKYCVNAYTYDGKKYTNGKDVWYINSLAETKGDLEEMKNAGCDYKIMMLHWGAEYRFNPVASQEKLAKELSDAGLDLLIGGHSHILGKEEKIGNTQVFYSLGNFIFDQNWGNYGCQKGMDCFYNELVKKKVVPTAIGTGIKFNTGDGSYTKDQFLINNGKLSK